MPQLSSLQELKVYLEIDKDDRSEDGLLLFLLEVASSWIEELLDRKLFIKSRTEYYSGTGTSKLLLKSRPVYTSPTIAVSVDDGGYYGEPSGAFDSNTALTYGTDFAIQLDPGEDGVSRSGILVRKSNVWSRPSARRQGLLSPYIGEAYGNIKVVYTAGYSVDSLPVTLRLACNLLVARLRYVFPLGIELGTESFEERSISIISSEKTKLLVLVRPLIMPYRSWRW